MTDLRPDEVICPNCAHAFPAISEASRRIADDLAAREMKLLRDIEALVKQRHTLRAALEHVLADDHGLVPRASSACRDVVRRALIEADDIGRERQARIDRA